MNKKSFLAITTLSLVSIFLVATAESFSKDKLTVRAEESNYSILLTNENKPTINQDSLTASLEISEYVTISYTNLYTTQVNDAHVTLGANGTIAKTLATYDLISITATFTGDLTITTGYTQDTMDNIYKLTSGKKTYLKGNYFVVTSKEYAIVNSLAIHYGCTSEDIEVPGISSYIQDYNLNYLEDDKGGYYGANEFSNAINNELGLDLPVTIGTSLNPNKNYIQFKTNSALEGRYLIQRNDNIISVSSYDAVGLIQAAKVLYSRLCEDSTNMESWYTTPVEGTYLAKEKIKTMTFNVRVADDGTLANGNSGNISNRAPRVIACIKSFMPDTIGVQEANDTWISALKAGLQPQYGYIGHGRDSNYKGESTGIFYNRNTVTLLKSETKWLSATPDVAGSKYDVCDYTRIMTYGIFQRHSDNYVYMHVNAHLDLNNSSRNLNCDVLDSIVSQYKEEMPIFVTGDFNVARGVEGDAVEHMLDDLGYIDTMDEALDVVSGSTFPQAGYYSNTVTESVIDYCMKKNRGLYFTKYFVDHAKYSGDGVEAEQLTSDHYPIYLEAIPYEPITPFTNSDVEEAVEIDNGFVNYDSNYNVVNTKSEYENHQRVLAIKAQGFSTTTKANTTNRTQYNSINGGNVLTYSFESDAAGQADLALSLANARAAAAGTTLSGNIEVMVNGEKVTLDDEHLRCSDIRQLYEWEVLALRDVALEEGLNKVTIIKTGSYMPDNLLLDIFSNTNITPLDTSDTSGLDKTNTIKLGSKTYSIAEFNAIYPNVEASVSTVDSVKTLTISLRNNKTTTIPLDTFVDVRTYTNTIINGQGKLDFTFAGEGDGIYCNNLTVEDGAELSFDKTAVQGTGLKCANGALNINGILTLNNFNYGFGGWDGANDHPTTITIGETGHLNMPNIGANGIYYEDSKPTFHNYGQLTINSNRDCIKVKKCMNFNFFGDSITNLVSETGSGIWNTTGAGDSNPAYSACGLFYIRGNSYISIDSYDHTIFGAGRFIVGDGSYNATTTCNASLRFKSKGLTVGTSSYGTKDANMFQLSKGCDFVLNTYGKIEFIRDNTTISKTCIKFNGSGGRCEIKCADITFYNWQNCIGTWADMGTNFVCIYEHTGEYNKIKLNNCSYSYNKTNSYALKSFPAFDEYEDVTNL